MLRDITLGQYYPVDSVLHRLDPRTKLFGTLVYIISLFVADGIVGYGAGGRLSCDGNPVVQGSVPVHGAGFEIHRDSFADQRQL